jgi:hypothetical protein
VPSPTATQNSSGVAGSVPTTRPATGEVGATGPSMWPDVTDRPGGWSVMLPVSTVGAAVWVQPISALGEAPR